MATPGATANAATVRVEREGPLAVVTIDRPARHNSFDLATDRLLFEAVRTIVRDEGVRAVVLTGAGGRAFCTGADVAEMERHAERASEHFDDLTLAYHGLIEAIRHAPQVFVAAVNGIAAGGGVGLALSCDLVVAGRSARFALAYANLGVSPDGGATAHLVRAIGPHRAREALLLDGGIPADTALAWGLVNRVVDDAEVLPAARALAAEAGARARHTVHAVKALTELASHAPIAAVLEAERRAIIAAGATAGFREGLAAFREKRKPRF